MSTKLCSFTMDIRGDARPRRDLADGSPAVFEALLDVFAPRVLWLQINGRDTAELDRIVPAAGWGAQPLWMGETLVPGAVLTVCPPGSGAALIAEMKARLAQGNVSSLFVSAQGALRHQAPETSHPAWYGRWKIETPPALLDLIAVRLQWTDDMRAFELDLPMSGYPLTATRLEPDGFVDDGDLVVAAANRATVLSALERVPAALGLVPGEYRWSNGGDYAPLFPADAADIRQEWLPRVNGGAGP
jgi:hypothetical protein